MEDSCSLEPLSFEENLPISNFFGHESYLVSLALSSSSSFVMFQLPY